MNLLIITQKVDIDDDILGFFHDWITEFAENFQQVIVICLEERKYSLPLNVMILSLGKEKKASKFTYLLNFYKYIWRERKNYDAVFVHMNAEYVLWGGAIWKALGKKISLWYVHKAVSMKLRIAAWLADDIFTSAKESFGIASKKAIYLGHGIKMNKFGQKREKQAGRYDVICVGRISPIKNQKLLIEAANILVNKMSVGDVSFKLIGGPVYERDNEYLIELKNLTEQYGLNDVIDFVGKVPNKNISQYYGKADLSLNLSPTGGMDKTVLESIASGLPVIAINRIFADCFAGWEDLFLLDRADPELLAQKIVNIKNLDESKIALAGDHLRVFVAENCSLEKTILKIEKHLND